MTYIKTNVTFEIGENVLIKYENENVKFNCINSDKNP